MTQLPQPLALEIRGLVKRFSDTPGVDRPVAVVRSGFRLASGDPVPATPQCPFGGMKESGMGRELGIEGLDAYTETKCVSIGLRQG